MVKVKVLFTPSTFTSEGPRNYAKYITMLFKSIGIETSTIIIQRFPLMILDIACQILKESNQLLIIPYVRFSELITVIILSPLVILRKTSLH